MSYLNAAYTITLDDALKIDSTLLDDIQMSTSQRTTELRNHIIAQWGIYEIAGETMQEFRVFIKYKFREYVEYYEKLLDAYETEIDWLDGDKETLSTELHNDGDSTYTPTVETTTVSTPRVETTETITDLPRSTSSEDRPRAKTNTSHTGTDTVTQSYTPNDGNVTERHYDTTYESERKKGNKVDLRENYYKKLRDIYHDFSDRFSPCFLHLFD